MNEDRRVKPLAKRMHDVMWQGAEWVENGSTELALLNVARLALSLIDARDKVARGEFNRIILTCGPEAASIARTALIDLDALARELEPEPKEPTLVEAVEAMLRSAPQIIFGNDPKTAAPLDADGVRLAVVRPAALDNVRAALARAKGGQS